MSNTLNFPKPSHADDDLMHSTYMLFINWLNQRARGEFIFDERAYRNLISFHQICLKTGYTSPVTSQQIIDIQSDFA